MIKTTSAITCLTKSHGLMSMLSTTIRSLLPSLVRWTDDLHMLEVSGIIIYSTLPLLSLEVVYWIFCTSQYTTTIYLLSFVMTRLTTYINVRLCVKHLHCGASDARQ
jgi:hypothetical protein